MRIGSRRILTLVAFATALAVVALTIANRQAWPEKNLQNRDEFSLLIDRLREEPQSAPDEPQGENYLKALQFDFIKKPVPTNAYELLVSKGAASLPYLLAHLSDDRATRVVLRSSFPRSLKSGTWFYDGRRKQVWGYDLTHGFPDHQYRLRIGDVCFVAIGDIVNRDHRLLLFLPTSIMNISSPLLDPHLAEAVRQDWQGVDDKQLQESLVDDLSTEERREGALFRLKYYYPNANLHAAKK